jgi:hypothetical protein
MCEGRPKIRRVREDQGRGRAAEGQPPVAPTATRSRPTTSIAASRPCHARLPTPVRGPPPTPATKADLPRLLVYRQTTRRTPRAAGRSADRDSAAALTCFDHQSDWEGVTVILDGNGQSVNRWPSTAEHDGTIRYSKGGPATAVSRRVQGRRTSERDPPARVLRPRHAPLTRWRATSTRALARGAGIRDRRRSGTSRTAAASMVREHRWRLRRRCVVALPPRRGAPSPRAGTRGGEWGTARCVWGSFCSSADPPHSPGKQGRYQHPWC